MTDAIKLPLTIEEITSEWLTHALAPSAPGIEVRKVDVIKIRNGFTTVVRAKIDINDAGKAAGIPEQLIFKGGFEFFTRDFTGEYAIHPMRMEAASYKELPALGLNVPKCWFSEFSEDQRQMMIVMEDLTLRNVDFCHGLRPVTAAQVRDRLTSLAQFHARTWDGTEIKPGGRYERFPRNGVAMFLDYMHHANFLESGEWETYCDAPRGTACAAAFLDLDWVLRSLELGAKMCEELPNVLVHGDTHLGNLYFEQDGSPGFFDALPRREPAMVEVAYHVVNALDPLVRRANDRDLVAHYREELLSCGVKAPSLGDLMHQYAEFLHFGFITFLINRSEWQTESFNTAHTARYNLAMLDNGTRALVDRAWPEKD
jgi:hypothetical protein